MNNKKFYWIKLKTEFFNQDTIDFLLSQKNGCEYIVLYQMLCLKTANNGGELTTNVGEMIIPYDIDKIVRDCKYFDTDTVMIALELFKKLNLIYEERDKILRITDIDEMVGSESASREAIKKREYRLRKKIEDRKVDKEGTNCPIEIENRDKSIDIDNIKKESIKKDTRFIKPSIEEIEQYCIERNNGINANAFYDFYESKNWMVGKNKMKDWKACVRTWENRSSEKNKKKWWEEDE